MISLNFVSRVACQTLRSNVLCSEEIFEDKNHVSRPWMKVQEEPMNRLSRPKPRP